MLFFNQQWTKDYDEGLGDARKDKGLERKSASFIHDDDCSNLSQIAWVSGLSMGLGERTKLTKYLTQKNTLLVLNRVEIVLS